MKYQLIYNNDTLPPQHLVETNEISDIFVYIAGVVVKGYAERLTLKMDGKVLE